MTSCATSFAPKAKTEPIPGYILTERIAGGGFGEVWKADAPGGLKKAVKFVYGTLDESRAAQELRSLSRIKEVSHPFLLSLERIEIVDGHLMIVSELADGCLMDRFEACRKEGQPGIPRDELLGYLRDAADVLDFLFDRFSLQHLDVKPQNLLLVGNHVKVADFGLLKNLQDKHFSQVGGITPLYAPPEVLSGRPSRFSDQYSLAVLFQEMLTGEPPFLGRTSAQLAAQHLHSPPSLRSLSSSDQPVVARALSKKPEARYPSCRAFVEGLTSLIRETPRIRGRAHGPSADHRTQQLGSNTVVLNVGSDTPGSSKRPACLQAVTPIKRELEPIQPTDEPVVLRPTVFVGLGGMGGRILHELRRRLVEHFHGPLASIPAVQMLVIDTNSRELTTLMSGESGTAFSGRETLGLPLRPSHEYRTDSQALLAWIGRRWLYNVPRSLQTDGIRPYGRLALVDNHRKVRERLKRLFAEVAGSASAASSSAASGQAFAAGAPNVILVSSTAGGTGGGMVVDFAYLVRQALTESGFDESIPNGMLVHAGMRQGAHKELAVVNTCACLSELLHYSESGANYPGDPSCGLPAVWENNPAFGHTYFLDLGEDLTCPELDRAINRIADYLWLSTLSPAAQLFERARMSASNGPGNSLLRRKLRTMSIVRRPASLQRAQLERENHLAHALVESWIDWTLRCGKSKREPVADTHRPEFLDKLILDFESQYSAASIHATSTLGQPPAVYSRGIVSQLVEQAPKDQRDVQCINRFDELLRSEGESESNPVSRLSRLVHDHLRDLADEAFSKLSEYVLQQIESAGARFHGAAQVLRLTAGIVEKSYLQARGQVERNEVECSKLRREIESSTEAVTSTRQSPIDLLGRFAWLRIEQCIYRAIQSAAAHLMRRINGLTSELLCHNNGLKELSARLVASIHLTNSDFALDNSDNCSLPDNSITPGLLARIDNEVSRILASKKLRLSEALGNKSQPTALETIRAAVRASLTEDGGSEPLESTSSTKNREPEEPSLWECGGDRRIFVIGPSESKIGDRVSTVPADFGTATSYFPIEGDDVFIVNEIEEVPIDNVLSNLLDRQADSIDAVRRIHTRIDVNWSI